jgi:geranylgeranyl reductase
VVIGADGANSAVARQEIKKGGRPKHVFAYHEIIRAPANSNSFDGSRCDIFYQGELSPDFYAWIFPHGDTASIGVGSAKKGFALRGAVRELRAKTGLKDCETVRVEGAPIPLKPLKVWDNKLDVVLAGDAAGVVAPASGEGIFYAMTGGRYAADAAHQFLETGRASALATARKRFMRHHGLVFWILGIMQYFWYASDNRRERFVKMCADPDVQKLTWTAYMEKELVLGDPLAHIRIFFKDLGHLLGLAKTS